jgi:hypothetical protein
MCRLETMHVTEREGHGLRIFEHLVLRKRIGPKRQAEIGDWQNFYKEEFHDYTPP